MPKADLVSYASDGTAVRVVIRAGAPWFVLADVCRVLDIAEAHRATARLDDDEKGRHTMTTPGGAQEVTIVSESGLYSLVLTSRKPEAKRFKKWITADVMPPIRKTGGYGVQAADPAALCSLLGYTERVLALEADNAALKPKAAAADRIASADGVLGLNEAAKALNIAQHKLVIYLRAQGWLYRRAGSKNLLGYQSNVTAGYLTHKVTTVELQDGPSKVCVQVKVTGLARLGAMLNQTRPPW